MMSGVENKKTFLVIYDYGQGGIWFLMDAHSADEIESLDLDFKVVRTRPHWMSAEEEQKRIAHCREKGFHWDIDVEPTGWLADFYKNKRTLRDAK